MDHGIISILVFLQETLLVKDSMKVLNIKPIPDKPELIRELVAQTIWEMCFPNGMMP